MSITAYASGNAAPITFPDVDPEIDLSVTALPTTQGVYGDAEDSNDAGATFTWSWTLLAAPDASAAALASPTVQNPTLNAIDTWGNYRLFLVATNAVTGETSETDPLLAPDSAFVVVRLRSEVAGIQKPAKGERNWFDDTNEWADAIEDEAKVRWLKFTVDYTDVAVASPLQYVELTTFSVPTFVHKMAIVCETVWDVASPTVRGAGFSAGAPSDGDYFRAVGTMGVTGGVRSSDGAGIAYSLPVGTGTVDNVVGGTVDGIGVGIATSGTLDTATQGEITVWIKVEELP